MSKNRASITFLGSLRDFTNVTTLEPSFFLSPSAKDLIESAGVPHVEVFGLLINGQPMPFTHNVGDGDTIVVIPKKLAGKGDYPQNIRQSDINLSTFVADVHLGKTARLLRLLGFDTVYSNTSDDAEIVEQSVAENRAVLTRDVGLLKHGSLKNGYWVRSTEPEEQLKEVIIYFELLDSFEPFTRCMECNGRLKSVSKESISSMLPPKVQQSFDSFSQCESCGKVYWKGSHYKKLLKRVKEFRNFGE